MSGVTDVQDSEAVRAIWARDRKFRRRIWLAQAVTIFILVALLAFVWQAFVRKTDAQTTTIRVLNAQAHRQQQVASQLLCRLQVDSDLQLGLLREAFKHFGATLPPLPGERTRPQRCEPGGTDPVFIGTSGDDVIHATSDPDWVNAEAGADIVFAEGGGDTLIAGDGKDVLWGGPGADYLYGNAGNDELHAGGDDKVDHLDGGAGNDTCYKRTNDVVTHCEKVVKI
jgi:Ca2+-binding RTX toxin-like protein